MPKECAAADCSGKAKTGSGISFHSFPKESHLLQQWLIQMNRLDPKTKKLWRPSPHNVLCSRHFLPTSYTMRTQISRQENLAHKPTLLPDAVPTIFDHSQEVRKRTALLSNRRSAFTKRRRKELLRELLEPATVGSPQAMEGLIQKGLNGERLSDERLSDRHSVSVQTTTTTTEDVGYQTHRQMVNASQPTIDVPLVPKIVALAPLKLPTTSNEANLTLAFSDAERQTDHISEQKKKEPARKRLLTFNVPVNSELYRKIRAADTRASGRAQEALQYFIMPITAATETERDPEESAGNSATSVDVERVKREPGECATESTSGFHGTPRNTSLCGKCTPSFCGTPGFHEVQVKFESEECATDSTQHFHEVQVKFVPEERATDRTQQFQVVQVRSDFEPAESAAVSDTPHSDVVQVKTEQVESAAESTFSSDVVQVKLEPEESAAESASSFDGVQVKLEPEESVTENAPNFHVAQVNSEPAEVMEGEAKRKHSLTMSCDTNSTLSHDTASNGVDRHVRHCNCY